MTYTEAYEAAKSGKRVRLQLPAKGRAETHIISLHAISNGAVMMHIEIEHAFFPSVYIVAIATDHPNTVVANSSLIGSEDLNKWEVIE